MLFCKFLEVTQVTFLIQIFSVSIPLFPVQSTIVPKDLELYTILLCVGKFTVTIFTFTKIPKIHKIHKNILIVLVIAPNYIPFYWIFLF